MSLSIVDHCSSASSPNHVVIAVLLCRSSVEHCGWIFMDRQLSTASSQHHKIVRIYLVIPHLLLVQALGLLIASGLSKGGGCNRGIEYRNIGIKNSKYRIIGMKKVKYRNIGIKSRKYRKNLNYPIFTTLRYVNNQLSSYIPLYV